VKYSVYPQRRTQRGSKRSLEVAWRASALGGVSARLGVVAGVRKSSCGVTETESGGSNEMALKIKRKRENGS